MTEPADHESLAAYIYAAAVLLDLRIAPENRLGVELQFARIAALARSVAEHRLDFSDEPAPLFHPGNAT